MWTSVPQSSSSADDDAHAVVVRPHAVLDLVQRRRKPLAAALIGLLLLMLVLSSSSSQSSSSPEHLPLDDDHQSPPTTSSSSSSSPVDDPPPPPSPGSSSSSSSPLILKGCPSDHAFHSPEFQHQCAYWLQALSKWKPSGRVAAYACRDETMCHGLGDRLAGMQGALSYAMDNSLGFRVEFPGLARLFAPPPCVFAGNSRNWTLPLTLPSTKNNPKECAAKFHYTCLMNQCGGTSASAVVFENNDKACLPPAFCHTSPFIMTNTVHLYGCGLRLMMEPTSVFMRYDVPLVYPPPSAPPPSATPSMLLAVAAVEQLLAKYFVIGIHFRIGDYALVHNKVSASTATHEPRFLVPFQCAATLEAHLSGSSTSSSSASPTVLLPASKIADSFASSATGDDEVRINGKPVRWFLASDSQSVRDMAQSVFGKHRLVMISTRPAHIAFAKTKRDALADTLAEWYLLGKADVLVANRIGGKTLFRGRLSSFSKSTWAYHGKHQFYDAGMCVKRDMLLDGTWRVAPIQCKKALKHKFDLLNQPHLRVLRERNLTFPDAWAGAGGKLFEVDDGKKKKKKQQQHKTPIADPAGDDDEASLDDDDEEDDYTT